MASDITPESKDAPLVSSALARATASSKTEAQAQGAIGCLLFFVMVGLLLWGMASCTGATFKAMGKDSARQVAEKAIEKPPEAAPAHGARYSDTLVIASAQQAVKRKLVDERSAEFRNLTVEVQPTSGTKVVCGQVNSKNRMGGYGGYQHFISAGVDELTFLEEEQPDFANLWNEVCLR